MTRIVDKFILVALVFICPALLCSSVNAGWKVVFEDNFDSQQLDRGRWATRYIYNGGKLDHLADEITRYRDNGNHIIDNGVLRLTAKKTSSGFESGMIRSRKTFYYGYFEARVRLPEGKGFWPAFWLNSDFNAQGILHWPPEIDIFEYVVNGGAETENMIHSTVKEHAKDVGQIQFAHPNYDVRKKLYLSDKTFANKWTTFGLLWTPTTVTVFIDGVSIYKRQYRWLYRDGRLAGPAHILLNMAVGGQWAGRHGIDDAFPKSLDVDYVRVCQYDAAMGASGRCGNSPQILDEEEFKGVDYKNDLLRPLIQCISNTICDEGTRLVNGIDIKVTDLQTVEKPANLVVRAVSRDRSVEIYNHSIEQKDEKAISVDPDLLSKVTAGLSGKINLYLDIIVDAENKKNSASIFCNQKNFGQNGCSLGYILGK